MKTWSAWLVIGFFAASCGEEQKQNTEATNESPILEEIIDELPNNFPLPNFAGHQTTFSTEGFVDLDNAFGTPPGTGRTCATCHAVESGWTINPGQIEFLFFLTQGLHPIFDIQDANNANAPVATAEQRYAAYSNLRRGLFRRNSTPPAATTEYDIIAVDDPNGFADTTRFTFFRRPLTSANLNFINSVLWDSRLTVPGDSQPPRTGLFNQARGTTIGALRGPAMPDPALINAMVDDELQIYHAQISVGGIRLDSCGGRGGPEILRSQTMVSGRFDLFDAWIELEPGSCTTRAEDRKRAQIARGQEIFNNRQSSTGRTCRGCHNVANVGSNLNGTHFDIGTSNPEHRPANVPLYTVRNRATGETLQTTDPGKAGPNGVWSDMNRFKTPTLRGVASRGPLFHNGIARNIRELVSYYSANVNFNFTHHEKEDLVAFLEAL